MPSTTPRRAVSPEVRRNAQVDSELVRRFLAGDERAFVTIIERHQPRVLAVAFGLLHNRADAEEVAQDTFIRAHRSIRKFRGDSSLATWLHRIASNLAKNRYWYFFRRRRHSTLSLDYAVGEDGEGRLSDLFASGEPDPAEDNCRSEFSSLIQTCMGRLGPFYEEILTLRNADNLSYGEIAARLGINPGTVKSRIARARERLRRRMAEACPEFAPDSQPEEWFDQRRSSGGVFRTLA